MQIKLLLIIFLMRSKRVSIVGENEIKQKSDMFKKIFEKKYENSNNITYSSEVQGFNTPIHTTKVLINSNDHRKLFKETKEDSLVNEHIDFLYFPFNYYK